MVYKVSSFSVMVIALSCVMALAGSTMRGKVKASFDKKKLESVTFTADGGESYEVDLNSKAKKLADDANGETVELKGSVKKSKDKEGNETSVLKVSSYRVVFSGKVEAQKDGKKLKAITLGGREVKLDSKAKAMLSKAEGKQVDALGEKAKVKTGSGKDKKETEMLVIKSFRVVDKKEDDNKDKKDKEGGKDK